MKPPGITPPLILLTNSKPSPCAQRLDLDVAVAELAAAAGLLLVAALRLGRALDRLPVGHARRLQVHLGAEAVLHAVDDHLDVDLREAGDDLLAGLRVAVEVDRRVLLLEAAQRLPIFSSSPFAFGLDRERHHRPRHRGQLRAGSSASWRPARRRSASPSASRRRRCRPARTRRRGPSPCPAARAAGRCAPWCARAVRELRVVRARRPVDAEQVDAPGERVGQRLEHVGDRLASSGVGSSSRPPSRSVAPFLAGDGRSSTSASSSRSVPRFLVATPHVTGKIVPSVTPSLSASTISSWEISSPSR